MTGTDLRVAVIGLGRRSDLAALAHRPGVGARVVAVADVRPARQAAARQLFGPGTAVADRVEDLPLSDVDCALVLSPDDTHEELAVHLLGAGVPVFVEKPLAITIEGCDRVLATARQTGTGIYVGHNMRHMPVILAMRRLIAEGAVGAVKAIWCRHFVGHGGEYYFQDWHADRRRTTGLLLQKGAHDLDVIHWLAGGYAQRVNALGGLLVYGSLTDRRAAEGYRADRDEHGAGAAEWEGIWPPASLRQLNPAVDVEDLSMVQLQLDNGVLASYQQCHFTPDYWRNYTVLGTEGRLENFGDTGPGTLVQVWNRRSGYRRDADRTVEVDQSEHGHGGADSRVVEEFLGFVRDGRPTVTSPVAARYAVAAGVAGTVSLRAGGLPVDVPALDPALRSYFTSRTYDSASDQAPDQAPDRADSAAAVDPAARAARATGTPA